jgi:lipopolysaccharide transport system ATP-binding protein
MTSIVPDMPDDVLIRAEHVSKKFCRSLKRSLWYGARDVASSLLPWSRSVEDEIDEIDWTLDRLPPLRYDEFWALQNISFELRRGQCLGLIGHNGAGKSTLLKVLNGLIRPDSGRIAMRGRVCALIELNAAFNPILSGRENIYNQAALVGFTTEQIDSKFDSIVEFAEIGDFLDMPVQNYSSGMRVRLGFAVAAQLEPDILLIDEVLAVGDVAFRFKCLNAIGELMKTTAVIFVSHTMPQIFRLCTEIIVMNHGGVSYQGTNIGEGVGVYLSLFKEATETVTGSGEVKLSNICIEGNGARACDGETLRVPFGSDLIISATLDADPGLGTGRVQFLLWNAEMLPILDVMGNGLAGHPVELNGSGRLVVTATIPRTELNSGKYSISVIATSFDYSRMYCRHDNAAYLQVDAASTSGAHFLTIAEWNAVGSSKAPTELG